MPRKRRFCPEEFKFIGQDGRPRGVFELTTRCIQGRYLMQPTPQVTRTFLGVLGRALERFPDVELYAYHALGNHQSLVAGFLDASQMADFMEYLNGNLARKLGRVVGWTDRFWSRRYAALMIADEPTLIERMSYSAANSVKEGLVERADRWPRPHFVKHILRGPQFGTGDWVDRTALRDARRRDPKAREADFTVRYTVRLSKLPIWNHLSNADYCERILELANRARDESVGVKRIPIFMKDRHHRPVSMDRSPAPDVLASNRDFREAWRQAYAEFSTAYSLAVERLRSGEAPRFPPCGVPLARRTRRAG